MTSVTTNLNQGYGDGFHNKEPKHPDNDDYMFGYDIGQVDGTLRKRHLKERTAFQKANNSINPNDSALTDPEANR